MENQEKNTRNMMNAEIKVHSAQHLVFKSLAICKNP